MISAALWCGRWQRSARSSAGALLDERQRVLALGLLQESREGRLLHCVWICCCSTRSATPASSDSPDKDLRVLQPPLVHVLARDRQGCRTPRSPRSRSSASREPQAGQFARHLLGSAPAPAVLPVNRWLAARRLQRHQPRIAAFVSPSSCAGSHRQFLTRLPASDHFLPSPAIQKTIAAVCGFFDTSSCTYRASCWSSARRRPPRCPSSPSRPQIRLARRSRSRLQRRMPGFSAVGALADRLHHHERHPQRTSRDAQQRPQSPPISSFETIPIRRRPRPPNRPAPGVAAELPRQARDQGAMSVTTTPPPRRSSSGTSFVSMRAA